MSAILPGYNYDIFISYRQKDNKHDGWVTEFVNNLKDELESTFKEEISVYFDINPHDGLLETHDVDASLKEKLKCLIFIPIISRTYCDPKSFAWEHEFKAFVEIASKDQFGLKVKLPNGNVASRVLPVRIHDIDPSDLKECENVTGSYLRGVEFIYKEAGLDKPLSPDDDEKKNLNKSKYNIQVIKLAHSIRDLIEGIKSESKETGIVGTKSAEEAKERKADLNDKLKKREKRHSKKKVLAISIITVVIITAIIIFYQKIIKEDKFNSLRNSDGKISLAVMPFDNLTGDTSLAYFGKGISYLIINGLGNSRELSVCDDPTLAEVIDGTVTINTAGISPSQARTIAKRVNAEAYISGSYQGVQDKYLIIVNLVSAQTGKIIWSDKAEGNIKSSAYLEIADSLCRKVKNYLEIRALEKNADYEFREAYPRSSEAYRYFIEGMEMVLKQDYNNGIICLEKSLNMDSTVMAGFYLTYAYSFNQQIDKSTETLRKIYSLRDKVPLKYQLWMDMWHACYIEGNLQNVTRYCDLLAASGINTRLLWFDLGVTYHEYSMQYDKSAAAFEKVQEINEERGSDWKFPMFYEFYGDDLHRMGKHEEELALYDKGLILLPDDLSILRRKAACLLMHGDTVKANECIAQIKESIIKSRRPVASMEIDFGSIYLISGSPEICERHFRKAFNLSPRNLNYAAALAYVLIVEDVNVDEGLTFISSILDTLSIRKNNSYIFHSLMIFKGVGTYKQGSYNEAVEILDKEFKENGTYHPALQHYLVDARQAMTDQKKNAK